MNESTALTALHTFRHALYDCFERRADALMELTDALLTAGPVLSPVHLSQEAVHRRGWGSLYAALAQGRVNSPALRQLLAQYPLAEGQPIYAVDCSVWARCAAATSPQRGYYYHSSRHSGGVQWWRGGPISGSASSASGATAGLRLWTCSASPAPRTSTPRRRPRSKPCSRACPPAVPCRSVSSMPATTPYSSPLIWTASLPPRWCACARIAASMPTLIPRRWRGRDGRCSMGTSLTVPALPCGQCRPRNCARRIRSTAPCGCGHGPGCIPSSRTTRPGGPARPARWSAAR